MGNNRHWLRHIRNIFTAYGLSVLWVVIVVNILQAFLAPAVAMPSIPVLSVMLAWLDHFPQLQTAVNGSPGLSLFMTLVFAPFIEEILFRMFPLTLVQTCRPAAIRAVTLAVCFVIFGWAHGSPLNVFIQGFVGLMLGWLYIKNASSQWASYISCVAVHALYNLTVVIAGGF